MQERKALVGGWYLFLISMRYRLAIVETHPIQYKAPWFRSLAAHPDIDLTVFYCMIPDARQQGHGFGVGFQWDIPLLEGYRYVVLENVAKDPGLHHFGGCDTPEIADYIAGRKDIETTNKMVRWQLGEDVRMGDGGGREGKRRPAEHTQDAEWPREPYRKRGESVSVEGKDTARWQGRLRTTSARPCSAGATGPRLGTRSGQAFDAVIINGWLVKGCLQALWACRRTGTPAILRCEASDLEPRAWWKTLVHRAILKQFSAFIAIGAANRRFYVRRGVPPERIVDGFYCVENERFQRGAREVHDARCQSRRRWGIPENAVCFLFCGKLEPKKRPMDVLRALGRVAAREDGRAGAEAGDGSPDAQTEGQRPSASKPSRAERGDAFFPSSARVVQGSTVPVHMLMVGDGELRGECETYARERRLPATFAGFVNQSEMPLAYAAADCLVLPSGYGETWGLVVNEAMACGLPAITSDRVGCHLDLVVPGRTGLTFPCGDVQALARAMAQLAADPVALRHMGVQAYKHIQAYSIENLVAGTLAALKLATGNRRTA